MRTFVRWSSDLPVLTARVGRSSNAPPILAEAVDFTSVIAWIADHDGQPEARLAPGSTGGLHGSRVNDGAGGQRRPPLRTCSRLEP
jgi:hypothetical protein